MRSRSLTALAAVAAAAVLVVGIDGATYAATGGSLILGRANTADAVTSIRTASGPALDLRTGDSDIPFTVNGAGKVWNLNVDRIDSLDSRQLQRRLTGGCVAGRALTGITADGDPQCIGIEPTAKVLRLPAMGSVDEPRAFRTESVGAGRWTIAIDGVLQPSVRGTSSAGKQGWCRIDTGSASVSAAGLDNGGSTAAAISATGLLTTQDEGLVITCGFDRGSWSFSDAPTIVLTPLPSADSVTVLDAGAASR